MDIQILDSLFVEESSSEEEPSSETENMQALMLSKKVSENLLSEIQPS